MSTASALPPSSSPAGIGKGVIQLRDRDNVIAAIPHLLGYHPTNSLVLMLLRETTQPELTTILCIPLPASSEYQDLIDYARNYTLQHDLNSVLVCIIGGKQTRTGRPPRRAFVLALQQHFTQSQLTVVDAIWAQSTQSGAHWQSYADPTRQGRVADTQSSLLAALSVFSGSVTHASRADLVASLSGADPETLQRRAKLLDRYIDHAATVGWPKPEVGVRLVRRALAQISNGTFVGNDATVARLALALSDYQVRDIALGWSCSSDAAVAEQLWWQLTRTMPAPERAEPATLLAFSAYLRGDGVLANVATEQAEMARPGHTLAGLLRRAIAAGLAPDKLRTVVLESANKVEHIVKEQEKMWPATKETSTSHIHNANEISRIPKHP